MSTIDGRKLVVIDCFTWIFCNIIEKPRDKNNSQNCLKNKTIEIYPIFKNQGKERVKFSLYANPFPHCSLLTATAWRSITTAKLVRCSQKHTVCVLLLICTQHPWVDQSLQLEKKGVLHVSQKFVLKTLLYLQC